LLEEGFALLPIHEFIRISIEVNLFFQRIMKEHMFFIETSLQPVEPCLIAEANSLKHGFEQLLDETVYYANGIISQNAIESNAIVTPYTLRAEQVSSMFTGASLNTGITKAEYELIAAKNSYYNPGLESIVYNINRRSYYLLKDVIAFKKKVLDLVSGCKIFITLFQDVIKHITREAEYYQEILKALQYRRLPERSLCDELDFWNNVMGEHALFISGLLDPTEENLKKTAETTAKLFDELIGKCDETAEKQIIQKSLKATEGVRDFKRTATQGILNCVIKSIIIPLLADHVLREANYYLGLLKMMER